MHCLGGSPHSLQPRSSFGKNSETGTGHSAQKMGQVKMHSMQSHHSSRPLALYPLPPPAHPHTRRSSSSIVVRMQPGNRPMPQQQQQSPKGLPFQQQLLREQQANQLPPFAQPEPSKGAPLPSLASQTTSALARRPTPAPAPLQMPARTQQVYINSSQVTGKQVITCSTGRVLGFSTGLWVDGPRMEVVSMDLSDKKGMGSVKAGNIELSTLKQIGDVILVEDETVLYGQDLDGRYGFIALLGMEVRTRTGDLLGKVRDFSFSPDTGALSRLTYDDFGFQFLPVTFFDCFSIGAECIEAITSTGVVVTSEARYKERKETSGVFNLVPTVLRSIRGNNPPGGQRMLGAGSTAPVLGGYRADSFLPQGYTIEQWERDIARWEAETGYVYEDYIRTQTGGGTVPGIPRRATSLPPQQRMAALPPPGRGAASSSSNGIPGAYGSGGGGGMSTQYPSSNPASNPQYASFPGRELQQQQQPQQPQYGGQAQYAQYPNQPPPRGSQPPPASDPRFRGPQQQQQQQPQYPNQPPQQQSQQQPRYPGSPSQPPMQQSANPQQQQQQQQPGASGTYPQQQQKPTVAQVPGQPPYSGGPGGSGSSLPAQQPSRLPSTAAPSAGPNQRSGPSATLDAGGYGSGWSTAQGGPGRSDATAAGGGSGSSSSGGVSMMEAGSGQSVPGGGVGASTGRRVDEWISSGDRQRQRDELLMMSSSGGGQTGGTEGGYSTGPGWNS